MNTTINDFFCGCGGMGLAFKQAGYTITGAWDFDKYAIETYKQNVDPIAQQADIRNMKWNDIPRASVWAFGFPCQDLSVAGKQAGFLLKCNDCGAEFKITENADTEDFKCEKCGSGNLTAQTRSAMFFEMMRLLRETKDNKPEGLPEVLVAENVKGLKKYIPILMQELEKNGYIGHIELYNSKYFNVAQNRERYYIIATRADLPDLVKMPSKQEDNRVPKLSEFLDDEVDEKYYIPDEKTQAIIKQALERLTELGKVHATLTPDITNKGQNGRRAKEDEAEMYTLTAQDIHGVIIQTPRGKNKGNIHDISPTLTSCAWEQNNFLVEKAICEETGLLNPDGVGKTLRVGGGGVAVKETQLPAHPRPHRRRRRQCCRLWCRNKRHNSRTSQTYHCACSQETTRASEIKAWSPLSRKRRKTKWATQRLK
ncbi:MAG: DNA cytosine methyltransferase [Firmicutes bacterium]|nr:DNA cytosine methyltransferase [Bacillota bacterium]